MGFQLALRLTLTQIFTLRWLSKVTISERVTNGSHTQEEIRSAAFLIFDLL